jgi:copper chaperone CopZ
MTHTYTLTGMTCSGCEAKVKHNLSEIPAVTNVVVSKDTHTAVITMTRHIDTPVLQQALGGATGKYHISESEPVENAETTQSWIETYKPILLIFGFITLVTLLVEAQSAAFDYMRAMRHFMAGFFLVFSFFKFLNLKGFAESYVMYDVLARKIPAWAYLYAFVEFWLGIAYLINYRATVTNTATFVVMSISIIGVLQSVLNKRKIQCACLGAVFKLPMSTVTIIEDGLMIAMSGLMLAIIK